MPVLTLSWFWIAVSATVPAAAAVLVAFPLWKANQPIFGNLVGTAVLFMGAFAMIMRERMDVERFMQACLDQGGIACWPEPSAFARFAIYAGIALVEMMALFMISLRVEAKLRRRGYAPEWQ
jgi:hypothetical protein